MGDSQLAAVAAYSAWIGLDEAAFAPLDPEHMLRTLGNHWSVSYGTLPSSKSTMDMYSLGDDDKRTLRLHVDREERKFEIGQFGVFDITDGKLPRAYTGEMMDEVAFTLSTLATQVGFRNSWDAEQHLGHHAIDLLPSGVRLRTEPPMRPMPPPLVYVVAASDGIEMFRVPAGDSFAKFAHVLGAIDPSWKPHPRYEHDGHWPPFGGIFSLPEDDVAEFNESGIGSLSLFYGNDKGRRLEVDIDSDTDEITFYVSRVLTPNVSVSEGKNALQGELEQLLMDLRGALGFGRTLEPEEHVDSVWAYHLPPNVRYGE